jgi:hypothetical protein
MTQERKKQFLEVVEQARKGDEVAKGVLLVILETERKPTILWKLRAGDVWWQDLSDGHHDVVIRVDEKIAQLRVARAYFAWERRIINEISMKWRDSYRALGEPLDSVLNEVEGAYRAKGASNHAACR